MNLEKLFEMENRHREEIISLLTDVDDRYLREIYNETFDKERNTWNLFKENDIDIGKYYDCKGILTNLRKCGIILWEYGYPYGINWFSINPEYRTILRKRYEI